MMTPYERAKSKLIDARILGRALVICPVDSDGVSMWNGGFGGQISHFEIVSKVGDLGGIGLVCKIGIPQKDPLVKVFLTGQTWRASNVSFDEAVEIITYYENEVFW